MWESIKEVDFDIIIDDGPHSLQSQKDALRLYLPKLKPNGILIIEDIQSLGMLVFFKFISQIPLKFSVRTFDYRSDRKGDDNVLFVVENSGGHKVFNRCWSFLSAFLGIGYEIWFRFVVITRNVSSFRQ